MPGSDRGGTALAAAVRQAYRNGETDYSLEPIVLVDERGRPAGRLEDRDVAVFCCSRGEREVQLTEAFTEREFDRFPRRPVKDLLFVIMTLYHEKFRELPVAFGTTRLADTLGEVASRARLRQLRVTESEKYAHVTFFFNGGSNRPFEGEEDVRILSPQGIPFDRVPELSLSAVTERVLRGLDERFDLVVTNFANGDVIGHTQNRQAKIACAEFVDTRVGQVASAAIAADAVTIVTADHGNLELMDNPDGSPHIAHTANPVPFILIDPRASSPVRDGSLADIAPTVLSALGLEQPEAMSGRTLAPNHRWGGRRRVLLVVLDGWGLGTDDGSNPIFLAKTPVWDELRRIHPFSRLAAAGEAVGLKPGKPGNSEAGHLNIGAGRVVPQDEVRLDQAMRNGTFSTNETLCRAVAEARRRNAALHVIGLLSERSSHGCIGYALEVLRMAKRDGPDRVFLHVIFDGRSTAPGSAPAMLEDLERRMEEIGVGRIASGMGRGIALDRGGDYAKTRRAYDAMVSGTGKLWGVIEGADGHG